MGDNGREQSHQAPFLKGYNSSTSNSGCLRVDVCLPSMGLHTTYLFPQPDTSSACRPDHAVLCALLENASSKTHSLICVLATMLSLCVFLHTVHKRRTA
eukprot:1137925-Pelagomonas_calceolata.AAC.1